MEFVINYGLCESELRLVRQLLTWASTNDSRFYHPPPFYLSLPPPFVCYRYKLFSYLTPPLPMLEVLETTFSGGVYKEVSNLKFNSNPITSSEFPVANPVGKPKSC
ncbi:hypothetical protein CEXT_621021 [Caerostris extrusa]|uniref:Uncharacterized protein n=1 Tax=Caerostris extrusa TaxID=172846 RepID=A0AAV4SMN8_CAEEX|nr:hypothetical protein CEXT_621021 [Caerostris extrusa]